MQSNIPMNVQSSTMPPIAAQLAAFVVKTTYEDLPPATVESAKALILDQLACELVGSTMPWVAPALALARLTAGAAAESTIVNTGFRCPAADAAFVNATYGQACEFDDATYGSAGHIGTATVPVALAVGERHGINGRELLTAVVVGYEVMYRLMAAVRPHHRSRGFHSQGIGGPFAAAAAAGKIIGLNEAQMTHALAIAGSHACGPLEYDQSGGEVKRIHAGIAAKGGIHSALLAQNGLTGPPTIIEGKRGFANIFADKSDVSVVTRNLGREFNIGNAWFKLYPAVGGVQTSIGAVEDLVRAHDIRPSDVRDIRIGLTESALAHCAAIRQPRDVLSAQFSLAFSVALAVVKRSNTLREYRNPANWCDREINTMMDCIEAYPDSGALGGRDFMATVTIALQDGRSFTAEEIYPRGSPLNPATPRQLDGKVRSLAESIRSPTEVDALIKAVRNIEALHNVCALTRLLAQRPAENNDARSHGVK
jgi:2-methylcitrate dehydratase PrpD